MANNQLPSFFLVVVVVFSIASSPSFAARNQEKTMLEPADTVTMSVYYETLCPYCAHFIVNHLVKLFQSGLDSIVNLRMIPWGNAWINPDGSISCQHGESECFLNAIEACTISTYPDVEEHFGFIHCIEYHILHNKSSDWQNCFETVGLSDGPIECYTSGDANVIEEKYANETAQLNPPHTFVPWVVVNNQPLEDDYRNFITYVCNVYEGERVPDVCLSLPFDNNRTSKKQSPPVGLDQANTTNRA